MSSLAVSSPSVLVAEFPMQLKTENTLRAMNPIARGKILKRQKEDAWFHWRSQTKGAKVPLPVTVTLTRIGRRMDAHDGLPAAFKHIADAITEWLGQSNDDTPLIEWRYEQEPRGRRPQSIRIRIETRREVA